MQQFIKYTDSMRCSRGFCFIRRSTHMRDTITQISSIRKFTAVEFQYFVTWHKTGEKILKDPSGTVEICFRDRLVFFFLLKFKSFSALCSYLQNKSSGHI